MDPPPPGQRAFAARKAQTQADGLGQERETAVTAAANVASSASGDGAPTRAFAQRRLQTAPTLVPPAQSGTERAPSPTPEAAAKPPTPTPRAPIDLIPDPEIEVLEYEKEIQSPAVERDRLRDLVTFPSDNIVVETVPRPRRTDGGVPSMKGEAEPYIHTCLRFYNRDLLKVNRTYADLGRERKVSTNDSTTLADQRYEIDAIQKQQEDERKAAEGGDGNVGKGVAGLLSMFQAPAPGADSGEGAPEDTTALGKGLDAELLDKAIFQKHTDQQDDRNASARSKSREHLFRVFSDLSYQPAPDDDNLMLAITRNKTATASGSLPSAPTTSLGPPKESEDWRPQAQPFTKEFGARFNIEAKSLSIGPTGNEQIEPMFCRIALFDVNERMRISEDFHFDFNGKNIFDLLGVWKPDVDHRSVSHRARLSVSFPNPSVYIVIRVDKVLQGDVEASCDLYARDALKEKDMAKTKQEILEVCPRLGAHRQPLAWSFAPLYDDQGGLREGPLSMNPLFRVKPGTLSDEHVFDTIIEFKEKGRQPKTLVGHLDLVISQGDQDGALVLDPSINVVAPPPPEPESVPVVRELEEFPTFSVYRPSTEYFNNLYIYPESVNVGAIPRNVKARNIACKIQLLETDADPMDAGMPAVYGMSSGPAMCNSSTTPVTYHNKTPQFYHEAKLALPPNMTSRHNLLFTFYHVTCQAPKKGHAPPPAETPVAYAFLPLIVGDRLMLEDSVHELPLANELPANYINKERDVKWLDGKRPSFRFRTSLVSSLYTQDPHLTMFFKVFNMENAHPKMLVAYAREVTDSAPEAVVAFLPTIIHECFRVLCSENPEEVRAAIWVTLLKVLDIVRYRTSDGMARCPILVSYMLWHFEDVQGGRETLHSAILANLVETFQGADKRLQELAAKNVWWLFEVLFRSVSVAVNRTGSLADPLSRPSRLPDAFYKQLELLIDTVRDQVQARSKTGLTLAKDVNQSLAYLIQDMFALLDRGRMFSLVLHYIRTLVPRWDSEVLIEFLFDFISVICHYEHYVQLNLPLRTAITNIKDLRVAFWQRHFLAGSLLHEVLKSLRHQEKNLRGRAIHVLRDLFNKHDFDPRYQDRERRERLALMYFPLVLMLTDTTEIVMTLQHEEKRDLLVCFVWVLKNSSERTLKQWWKKDTQARLIKFMSLLGQTIQTFQYIGKIELERRMSEKDDKVSASSAKAMLEQMYSGMGSGPTPSRGSHRAGLREQRQSFRQSGSISDRRRFGSRSIRGKGTMRGEVANIDTKLQSCLTHEVSMAMLDVLELFISEKERELGKKQDKCTNPLMEEVFNLLLALLTENQSESFLFHIFQSLRAFIHKFSEQVFAVQTHYLVRLIPATLKYCNSRIASVRAQASGFMYALAKKNFLIQSNFVRVKTQLTISMSKLVAEESMRDDTNMRLALAAIAKCADLDVQASSLRGKDKKPFGQQVTELSLRLNAILRDTVKIHSFQGDAEMTADLYYRIAKGYTNAPDLRVAWLENLSKFHQSKDQYAEAAQCVLHIASLVSEYLHVLEPRAGLPVGCVAFEKISPNVKEEAAIAESVEEEGMCEGQHFSEDGLVALLKHALALLHEADLYEVGNEVYKLLLPIYEKNRNYKVLADAHRDLSDLFDSIYEAERTSARALGSYYRVGFYGQHLGELDKTEFVYKEPKMTMLPEFVARIREQFTARVHPTPVVIIPDSRPVDAAKLDANKVHIQITSLEPYFEPWEAKDRMTYFERRYNLKRFLFETPFTASGRPHGATSDQCKRKTILNVEPAFPYLRKRLMVAGRDEIVLSPIENAVDEIEGRVTKLQSELTKDPPQMKTLQMTLQGSVRLQVNAGPREIANVFLSKPDDFPLKHVRRLRGAFRAFLKASGDCLSLNASLIGPEQVEYHEDLWQGFQEVRAELEPMLGGGSTTLANLPTSSGVDD